MRVTSDSITTFATKAMPWLERDPVGNNVIATLVEARLTGHVPLEPDALWLEITDDADNLVGVATVTPPRGVLLSAMPAHAARCLAEHLAATRPNLPSVNGPVAMVAAFRKTFVARTGVACSTGVSTRAHRLASVRHPVGVSGSLRAAGAADRGLLVTWSGAFSAEATPGHPSSDPALAIDSRLHGDSLLWLWEVGGEPVSTAWLSQRVAGVSRISGVYTPPGRRGHGYASACVAGVSQYALRSGATACILYTDLANPTSNKIYYRIGYRPVGDFEEWCFRRGG